MKKKNFLWSLLTMIMVGMLSVSLISCGGDDNDDPNNGQPVNPGTNVNDPTGTVSLAMRNTDNGNTYLDNIRIKNENFIGASFVSLGAVRGLGNVSTIPTSGWADQVAVEPGYGYVAYSNNQFYRIYVVDNIVNTSGGVMGADIKYQKPFKGVDEAIQLSKAAVTISANGSSEQIIFKNKSILVYEASSDQSWCHVNKCSTNDFYFLYNGVSISCDKNAQSESREATVTLETAYEKKVTIKVTQAGQEPFITLQNQTLELTSKEQTLSQSISTNVEGSSLQVTGTTSWCKAEIVTEAYARPAVRFIGMKKVQGTTTDNNSTASYYLKLQLSENTTENERSANIVVKSSKSNAQATLKVVQKGVTFEVSKNLVMFDKNNSNQTLTITTTASNWEAKSSASWCTFSRNGNQLTIRATATTTNREAKITFPGFKQEIVVNQSKYAVGDSYDEGKIHGTVGYMGNGDTNADYRLIFASINEKAVWSTENVSTGATVQNDGRKNVEIIKKIANWEELYPAFALCDALNTGGVTGWYLPAYKEANNIVDKVPRNNRSFWSSSEYRNNAAYICGTWTVKSDQYFIVAVHRF